MPNKLRIDSLSSEITTLNELLSSARQSGDIVGEMQLKYRISELAMQVKIVQRASVFNDKRLAHLDQLRK